MCTSSLVPAWDVGHGVRQSNPIVVILHRECLVIEPLLPCGSALWLRPGALVAVRTGHKGDRACDRNGEINHPCRDVRSCARVVWW